MRVFLLRPNSELRATTLPLGLAYVAEAVRRAGHEVAMLDARLERLDADQTLQRVLAFQPEVVGLSAIHFEKARTVEICTRLRAAAPAARLVLGGPLVSTSGRELVAAGVFDAAVQGEGEQALPVYLAALEGRGRIEEVGGLIYRAGGEIRANPPELIGDLDEILPAWDLIAPPRYYRRFGRSTLNMLRRSSRTASIFTSRGCPFGCIYCHNVFGRRFRARSAERVVAEVRMLARDYGVEEIEIVDDCFNLSLDRAKAIARGLAETGLHLNISFSNGLRADRMDFELIDLLRAAGTYRINYAIESAAPRIQELIHKRLDLDKTREIIAYTAGRGIFTLGYFMIGFPTETEAEIRQTIAYARESKLHAASFFYVRPFPGTELAEGASLGQVSADDLDTMDYTKLKINLSAVPDEVLRGLARQAYRQFHFTPSRMWRTFRVVPKNFRTLWSVLVIAALSFRDLDNF